jgi:hypothetical protein
MASMRRYFGRVVLLAITMTMAGAGTLEIFTAGTSHIVWSVIDYVVASLAGVFLIEDVMHEIKMAQRRGSD